MQLTEIKDKVIICGLRGIAYAVDIEDSVANDSVGSLKSVKTRLSQRPL